MDPWLWAVFNENGDAYDTFSGNRNPLGGLIQGGQNKNSFSTFRGGLKATIDFPMGIRRTFFIRNWKLQVGTA